MNQKQKNRIFYFKLKYPLFKFGILYLLSGVILSLFAYTFIVDKSINANEMILEVSNKNPGYCIDIIKMNLIKDVIDFLSAPTISFSILT